MSDADSTALEVTELLNEGYDADLTSASAMVESAEVLHERFGISPATVTWELLSQSTSGSVLTLEVPHSFELDRFAETLEDLGYTEPDSDTGVWVGGDQLIASIAEGESISPQFAHVAIDRERHLVLTSDDEGYLATAVEAVESEEGGSQVADVAGAAGAPVSAVLLDAEQACRSLAMSQADEVDQATAAELLAAAGEGEPADRVRARRGARRRRPGGPVLRERGPGPHQRRHAGRSSRPAPRPDRAATSPTGSRSARSSRTATWSPWTCGPSTVHLVLSDLSSGPVLFATC